MNVFDIKNCRVQQTYPEKVCMTQLNEAVDPLMTAVFLGPIISTVAVTKREHKMLEVHAYRL